MAKMAVEGFTVTADPPDPNPLGLVPGSSGGIPHDISTNVEIDGKGIINTGANISITGCTATGGFTLVGTVNTILLAVLGNVENDSKDPLTDDVNQDCPGGVQDNGSITINCIGCVFRIDDPGQSSVENP